MTLNDLSIYDENLKNTIQAELSDNVFEYDEFNDLLPDYFHDIKLSNLYGLYFLSKTEKEELINKEDLKNTPLSFFKQGVNLEFGNFVDNKETYLRQLKLDKNQAQELLHLYQADQKIAYDPLYYKNLVKLNMIEKRYDKTSLLEKYNQIFFNKQTVSLKDMRLAYSIVVELVKNNFDYTHEELLILLTPVLNNVPLTFLTLLEFFFTKEVDASNIPAIWSTISEKNMGLLELRETIITQSSNQKFYVDLKGLPTNIPFYDSNEYEEDAIDTTRQFLESITSTNLSNEVIDFLVSLSEWLYKYNWEDYEYLVEGILQRNNVGSNFFETEFYNFYIRRILDEL